MGLEVNANIFNNARIANSKIDVQALNKVKEQIFNPEGEKKVDVSKLNLDKFNRVSLGTDLYSQRTNGDVALQASKAATDFGVNFSKQFNANIQILNSIAAQSLLNSQNAGHKIIAVDLSNQIVNDKDIVVAASQTNQTKDLQKDRRGANPFSFFYNQNGDSEDVDASASQTNIFA